MSLYPRAVIYALYYKFACRLCSHSCVTFPLGWENICAKFVILIFFFSCADQEERTKAIEAFKEGKKDVLVATDVASKGLDFPAIQHVVNYDMPEEIENYGKQLLVLVTLPFVHACRELAAENISISVHRIGRTGRSGKTGIATTFINKGCGQ